MSGRQSWREIVASALDWREAHASFDAAVAELPVALRGRRPEGLPYSPWELLEHLRIAQHDLVEFMENPAYESPRWPDDYWPGTPVPPNADAWDASVEHYRRDRERLQQIAIRSSLDLTSKIPWGNGQTYLRTLLLALDHTAYHVGQLVAVRRLLGAWKEGA
ncbi:MAG TPA: DinB family protein [Gemmatimonadaceae bacterium]|nr:DinB family protein [Gemmatimonadaceae bacterium]